MQWNRTRSKRSSAWPGSEIEIGTFSRPALRRAMDSMKGSPGSRRITNRNASTPLSRKEWAATKKIQKQLTLTLASDLSVKFDFYFRFRWTSFSFRRLFALARAYVPFSTIISVAFVWQSLNISFSSQLFLSLSKHQLILKTRWHVLRTCGLTVPNYNCSLFNA